MSRLRRAVNGAQAAYLVATGVWPILHRSSFERIVGEKNEFWLVRTVGGLAAAQGLALGISTLRRTETPEIVALALASTVVFGVADLRAARTESPVYLGDAILQAVFAAAWLPSVVAWEPITTTS